MPVVINGVGLACADYLFTNLDFDSPGFKKYASRRPGDGGVSNGRLIFQSDLVEFAGKPLDEIRRDMGWLREPDRFSVGGCCIVSLINAAQLLKGGLAKKPDDIEVNFFASMGQDETGDKILDVIEKCRVNLDHYLRLPHDVSGATLVLSDPKHNNGSGERSFVSNFGTCNSYTEEMMGEEFYKGDILLFSATASLPLIHRNLTKMLRKAKSLGKITMVGTVFDFLNEKLNPGKRWPLGESDETYKYIDLLAVDWVEAQRMSGEEDVGKAVKFFIRKGVKSIVVTNGDEQGYAWSNGEFFTKTNIVRFSICKAAVEHLRAHPELRGDTTGCGDNFAGGLLASIAKEFADGKKPGQFSLADALAWGNASGSFCCYSVGGTFVEKQNGEKLTHVRKIHDKYVQQLREQGMTGANKL